MKKIYFALIALSACAFVACNEIGVETVNETPGTVEMTVVAGDATSKTALSGTKIIWSGTEKLKVIEAVTGGTDDKKFPSKDSSAGTTEDGGQTMSFNVTLDSHEGATSFQYVALYPNTAFNKATSLSNIAVNSLSAQDPSATGFDPAADFLISQVSDASASQPTSINMAFARKIAIAEMTIKNLDSSDDITSITFSAVKDSKDVVVAGRSKVDFTTSTVDYGSNLQSYAINMDYTGDNVKANTSSGAKTYFTCYPFSLAADDQFTVVVETASHRFTRVITLAGAQTLEFNPGDVSRFSVNMTGVTGVAKAVSLRYAEFTREDVFGHGITTNSYSAIDLDKAHGDKWTGYVNYYNSGFGIRRADDGQNDSFVKLPDFTEEISTVTVTLSASITAGSEKALLLESADDTFTGSIASLDAVTDQMEYVFDVASDNINTAYLRCKGAAAYIKKVAVVTKKAENRTQLSAPTDVTAALDGTNDIALTWTKAADAVGYEIVCTPTAGNPVVKEVGDVASYTVEGLANNTEYTITMYSIPDYYTHTKSVAAASTPASVTTTKGASYVLEAVKATGNNGYASSYNVTINEKQWNAPGNQSFDGYWRIGGKSITNADRVIYSKEAITSDNITSVVITTNGKSNTNLTVNSVKVEVYDTAAHAAAGGSTGRVAELTNTDDDWAVGTSKVLTFNKADATSWESLFYRITFNLSNSKSSNYGVDFQKAEFFE